MNLWRLQEVVYGEYVKNGFEEEWNSVKPKEMGDIAELGMITTEVSEAIEAVRAGDEFKLRHELADIAIRLMNFATRHHVNLERRILSVNELNKARRRLHGKEVI